MTAYNLPTSFTTSCGSLVAIEYKSLFRFLSESITLKVVLCSRTTDFFKNAFFVQRITSLTGWCRPGLEVQKCKCPKRRKYRSSWKYKFAAGGDILPSAFLQGLLTRYSIGVLTCSTTLTSRTVLSCATRFEKNGTPPKEEVQIHKVPMQKLKETLHQRFCSPIELKAKSNSDSGIISCTEPWPVQEIIHCTKNVFPK